MRSLLGITTLIVIGCSAPSTPTVVTAPAAGLAAFALASPAFRWDSVVAPGIIVYVNRGSWADSNRAALVDRVGGSLRHATGMLGIDGPDTTLRVFFVASRDEMNAVAGVPSNGITQASTGTVALVANREWRPFDRHEIMHAVSLRAWGEPGGAAQRTPEWRRNGWLREGIAAAAEDRCGAYSGLQVVAAMHAGGRRITLDDLFTRFYELDDLDAYLQAGTLVQFLLEQHGRERFRDAWKAGGDPVVAVYGTTVADLDAAWQAWVARTPMDGRPDIDALRVRGCG